MSLSGLLFPAALLLNALPAAAAPVDCCPIVELRQYTMYPGRRDTLITLFENEFIETQEAVGIRVLGLFRDINNANRFVWMRGFPDMQARRKALTDFYFGPDWTKHREQANATLFDNDNVLLLHPASPGSGMHADPATRPPKGASIVPGFVVATIYYFAKPVDAAFVERFNKELLPVFEHSGARVLARFASEHSENTFPRLPVRENEHAFVWFAGYADRAAYERSIAALAEERIWRDELFSFVNKAVVRPPETLMLQPTARSLVR